MTGVHSPTQEEPAPKIAVFGGSGFVGQAVLSALDRRGIDAISIAAPRLDAEGASELVRVIDIHQDVIADLASRTGGCTAIVNAAGIADPGCRDLTLLTAANGVLPGVIGAVASRNNQRFIHISSAAVQGRAAALDQSEDVRPFSPYSESKALGERLALHAATGTVVYRPPGVHSADRAVTRSLARVARSRAASVAGRGDANTAQALVENVSDAVAFLATCSEQPPRFVSHPSEGLTTSELLRLLGGRDPLHIPLPIALAVVALGTSLGRVSPRLASTSRRVEMLWFGQAQATSWLDGQAWLPVAGTERWREIGRAAALGTGVPA